MNKFLWGIIILFIFSQESNLFAGENNQAERENLFQELMEKDFTRQELENIFSDKRVEIYDSLIGPFGKENEKKRQKYLEFLLSDASVQDGKTFLLTNEAILSDVEKEIGVDKEIIVSVMKVETDLGRYFGNYRVFNVYNTLYFKSHSVKKREWAKQELICFLVICKENGFDPLSIFGSSAGAFGWCQFLPSSWKYTCDGNNDGVIDLFNFTDAAYSTAIFLRERGKWQEGKWNKEAIFKYNRSLFYVKTVYLYAQKIGFDQK
ncbi:MAG: lytic murein transglycosylase [Patescibacteria group bacterium]|nr:lytic murein transglycosylase [Patescibacteria group bacterium]MDD5534829.1 lytic murein transglycosylase [Patescibacteria group bacterium]